MKPEDSRFVADREVINNILSALIKIQETLIELLKEIKK